MLDVVPLRYGTVFKKAFSDPLVFTALVKAAVGIDFTPTRIEQEYSYPERLARAGITYDYDLFAVDEPHRTIVQVQHLREKSSFDRLLGYHCIGLIEQVVSSGQIRFAHDVYTLVVLTCWPKAPAPRFGYAACDPDPLTWEGKRLGVYRHRLVFIDLRAPAEQLPPELRRLAELFEDSLDRQVDETSYTDEVSQHILERIRWANLTPRENALVKDDAGWEAAKREAYDEGFAEGYAQSVEAKGRRVAIVDLCEALGLTLSSAQQAQLESLDLAGLEDLRRTIKQRRAWP